MDNERLVELIAQRCREDPRVEKIVSDARLFDKLKEDPAWQKLRDYIVSRRDRWMDKFAQQLMRGEVVDQRVIDYNRGFYDGARYAVLIPEVALANLHRVAEQAWTLGMAEELTYDQEAVPYE